MVTRILSILTLFLLVTSCALAQQTQVWEIVDTSHAQYFGTGQWRPGPISSSSRARSAVFAE
jgi:hypothetical protein